MEKVTVRLSRSASPPTPSARPEVQNGEQPAKEKQCNVSVNDLFSQFTPTNHGQYMDSTCSTLLIPITVGGEGHSNEVN